MDCSYNNNYLENQVKVNRYLNFLLKKYLIFFSYINKHFHRYLEQNCTFLGEILE